MSDRLATIVVWIALAVAAAGLETLARIGRRRLAGLGEAFGRFAFLPAGRLALALGWMWLGWHVFAR